MASTTERSRTRRERTFVGSECAVCEEPLEHTLRGERILQFSCTHVSHEACFYEYIREFDSQYCPTCEAPLHLDTSRSGNVIDIGLSGPTPRNVDRLMSNLHAEKISNMVRSGADSRSAHTPTPTWDSQTVRPPSVESGQRRAQQQQQQQSHYQQQPQHQQQQQQYAPSQSTGRDSAARGNYRESRETNLSDRYNSSRHARSDSEATGLASSGGYPETMQSGPPPRRHDYDLQAMETTPGSPRPITRNPIPAPIVTVRSEFPTINRSRQQQTLTCLVTVEVPDNNWRAAPEDLTSTAPQGAPSVAPSLNARVEEPAAPRPPSPVQSAPRFIPYESAETLDEVTENLRNRVENWHSLDFSRYAPHPLKKTHKKREATNNQQIRQAQALWHTTRGQR